jgi:hypothetical protein
MSKISLSIPVKIAKRIGKQGIGKTAGRGKVGTITLCTLLGNDREKKGQVDAIRVIVRGKEIGD